MAAIALLDLLRKNPNFGSLTFNSRTLFGNPAAVASFGFSAPFAFGALLRNDVSQVAYCDAAGTTALDEDLFSSLHTAAGNFFPKETLIYSTKKYNVELKPIFSAFELKTFALTSLRSFLLFYLPLLEPKSLKEEDDEDDFPQEDSEENRVDLVLPFKKSLKQITRETTVVTTRRVLERFAVYYVSPRMAWKLLKDVSKSAARKAGRRMPTLTYISCVSKTTFRGHFLAVLASWAVQSGIDIYRCVTFRPSEEEVTIETSERIRILGKKVIRTTIRCSASLIFASIGAGIGASLIRPSIGQWIGCTIGDLGGPFVVALCFEKLHFDV